MKRHGLAEVKQVQPCLPHRNSETEYHTVQNIGTKGTTSLTEKGEFRTTNESKEQQEDQNLERYKAVKEIEEDNVLNSTTPKNFHSTTYL